MASVSSSTKRPAITQEAIARRRFSKAVNDRLRETTILRVLPDYFKGDLAIDVGAAVGHITYFLKDHYPRVWSFEAVPLVYERLIEMAEYPPVRTVLAAVSDYDGEGEIFIDHKRLSNSGFQNLVGGPSIQQRVLKLDTFFDNCHSDIGFIKIDVEGTEWDVLRGARRIIESQKPTLIVEIYEPFSKYPLSYIFDWLMKRGYKCGFYSHPELVEVTTIAEGVEAVKRRHKEHDGDFAFWI